MAKAVLSVPQVSRKPHLRLERKNPDIKEKIAQRPPKPILEEMKTLDEERAEI